MKKRLILVLALGLLSIGLVSCEKKKQPFPGNMAVNFPPSDDEGFDNKPWPLNLA